MSACQSSEREKGPVEILCKEIDFRFDRQMESQALFVSFVSGLVREVDEMREWRKRIADIPGVLEESPSDDSGEVLLRACEMLAVRGREALIAEAANIHHFISQVEGPEDGPCDHLIDMVSSCVSAIRFGLETPCHSRHAAEAANHIWRKKYGVRLEDQFTPAWQKDWARAKLQEAILRLALANQSAESASGEGK